MSRLTTAYAQLPDDTEWIPGDALSADEIRNQEVLVMGHGKCTVTYIAQGFFGRNEHTLKPIDDRTAFKTTLKCKENNGSGTDFKLARRDVLARVALEKTPKGVGLRVADDGEVLEVFTEEAKLAGAQPGAQIRAVNGQPVSSKADIVHVLQGVPVGQTVNFSIESQHDRPKIRAPEPEPEPEPEAALRLSSAHEHQFNAQDRVSSTAVPRWPEWAMGDSVSDEANGQKVLLQRKVNIDGYGIGRIMEIHKPWTTGPRHYTVHFLTGRKEKLQLASKDNGGHGTAFWVERTPVEIRQSRAEERAVKIAQQLTTDISEALATKSSNLRDFFEGADANGDGKLSVKELFDGIQMLTGKQMSKGKLQEAMAAIDVDGDTEVSWKEFAQQFHRAEQRNTLAKHIGVKFQSALDGRGKSVMDAFQHFDTNGDGKLSKQELLDGFKKLKIKLSHDEVTKLMAVLDSDGDGEISYAELADFCDRATTDEEDFVQLQRAKQLKEKYAEFERQEAADLRELCWDRGLDDAGSKQECCSLLARHSLELVPEEWHPGDHLSDGILVGKRVLVKGYGKGTVQSAQKRFLLDRATRHEFRSETTGTGHLLTLKTKENPTGTPFKFFDITISDFGGDAVCFTRGRCCSCHSVVVAHVNPVIIQCWRGVRRMSSVAMAVLQSLSHVLVFGEFALAIWRVVIAADALTLPSTLWERGTHPHSWSHLSSQLTGKCDRLPLFWTTSVMCLVLEMVKCLLEYVLERHVRFGISYASLDMLLAVVAWSSEIFWWRTGQSGWAQTVAVVAVLLVLRIFRCAGRVWLIFEAELRAWASGEDVHRQRLTQRYEQISKEDLQRECVDRWLDSTGRHADLVQRLVDDQASSSNTRFLRYNTWHHVGTEEHVSEDGWVPVQMFDDVALQNRRIRHKDVGIATVVGVEKARFRLNKHILVSDDGTRVSIALKTKDNAGRGDDCEVEQDAVVINKAARLARSRRLGNLALPTLWNAVKEHSTLLAATFRDNDVDGDGSISIKQLQSGLRQRIGTAVKRQHLQEVLASSVNASGDSSIDWQEFLEVFRRAENSERLANKVAQRILEQKAGDPSIDLLQVFGDLDTNADGVLSEEELQIGLRRLGTHLSAHDIADLMSTMDKDYDRRPLFVDYQVFVARVNIFGTIRDQYIDMGVDELRAECSRRGLAPTGSTEEILERIVDHQVSIDRSRTAVSSDDGIESGEWVDGTSFSAQEVVGCTIMIDGIVSRVKKFKRARVGSHQHVIRVANGGTEQTVRLRTKDNGSNGNPFQVKQEISVAMRKSAEARAALLFKLLSPRIKRTLTTRHHGLETELRRVAKGERTVPLSDIQDVLVRLTSEKLGAVEIQKVVTAMGPDGDLSIDCSEFCHVVRRSTRSRESASQIVQLLRQKLSDRGADLQTAFDSFDTDGNGTLSHQELRNGLEKVGIELSPPEVHELMRFADSDSDNSIDWHEFLEMVREAHPKPSQTQSSNDTHESEKARRARARRTKHIVASEIHKALRLKRLSLDAVFRQLDANGDGRLSAKEVQQGIARLTGKELRKSHLRDMLSLTDFDGSTIEWAEFREMYEHAHKDQELSNEVLRKCRGKLSVDTFRRFDSDGNGSVDEHEMRKGLESMGIDLTKAQIQGLFAVVDENGDGSIDYKEFVSLANLDGVEAAEFAHEAERRQRLRTMSLPELKHVCADEGVDSSGLKNELIDRLLQLRREDEVGIWETDVSRPAGHRVDDSVDDGDGTDEDHNMVWKDGSSIMGHNLTPGTIVKVEGYGRGKVLNYTRRIIGANEHTIEFARGQRRALALRTSDAKGRGRRFQTAQHQLNAEDALDGKVYTIEKLANGFGMKISEQGIITGLIGKNSRDAEVPVRGTITRVNGVRVNGKRDIVAVLETANGGRGFEIGERVSFQVEMSLGLWISGDDWDDSALIGRRVNIDSKGIGRVVHCDRGALRSVSVHTVEMDDGQELKQALRTRGNAAVPSAASFRLQLTAAETKSRLSSRRATMLANSVTPRERKCLIDRNRQLEEQLQERAGSAQVLPFSTFEQTVSDVMKTTVSTKMLRQHFTEQLAADEREYDDDSLDWSMFCAGFSAAYRGQRLAAILSRHRQHLLSRTSDLLEWCEDTSSGNNILGMQDLNSLLSKLGVKLSRKDLAQMDEYADVNGEVHVDFRELVAHIENAPAEEELPRQRYEDMSLTDLKAECERQGLDTIGLKADLIDRLLCPEDEPPAADSIQDPVANIAEWLPGEQFSARDIVGRTIHVRTKGRGRVDEMHKGLVWSSLQHQVSLGSGTHKIMLRCKENLTARGAMHFRVEPDDIDLQRARRIARARRLTQLVSAEMRKGMKSRDMSPEEAFRRIDTNGDGVLSAEEFATGLQRLTGNDTLTARRLRDVMQTVDTDGDDSIDWMEFCEIFERSDRAQKVATIIMKTFHREMAQRGASLLEAFDSIDTNGDGVISQQELIEGLRSVGVKMSDRDVAECMAVLDSDGKAQLDYREFIVAARSARDEAHRNDLSSHLHAAELSELKQLCVDQGLSSRGLKKDLIERLMEIGVREEADIWVGDGPDLDVWMHGYDVPDHELEGQSVNVKGFGDGRVLQVESRGWGGSLHTVELSSGDKFTVSLASLDNSGNGTAFVVRRDQQTIAQNKKHAKALKIITPVLLRALMIRGTDLERALRAADEDDEGILPHRTFVRTLLRVVGGERVLGPAAAHQIMSRLDKHEDGIDWKAFYSAFQQAARRRNLAIVIGHRRGISGGRMLSIFQGLSNGSSKLSQTDFIAGLRALQLRPRLSGNDEDEVLRILGKGPVDFRVFVSDLQQALALARRIKDAQEIATVLKDNCKSQLDDFGGDLIAHFEALDPDEDGLLSQQQLMAGLRRLEIRLSRSEQRELVSVMDEEGDGMLDYRELVECLRPTSTSQSVLTHVHSWKVERHTRAQLLARAAVVHPELRHALLASVEDLRSQCSALDTAASGALSREEFERALLSLSKMGTHRLHDVITLQDEAAALESGLRSVYRERGSQQPEQLARALFKQLGKRVDVKWVEAALPLVADDGGSDASIEWATFCDVVEMCERTERLANLVNERFRARLPHDLTPLLRALQDFDQKERGHISLTEALVGLWEHGLKMQSTEVNLVVGSIGSENTVDYTELVELLGRRRKHAAKRSSSVPRMHRSTRSGTPLSQRQMQEMMNRDAPNTNDLRKRSFSVSRPSRPMLSQDTGRRSGLAEALVGRASFFAPDDSTSTSSDSASNLTSAEVLYTTRTRSGDRSPPPSPRHGSRSPVSKLRLSPAAQQRVRTPPRNSSARSRSHLRSVSSQLPPRPAPPPLPATRCPNRNGVHPMQYLPADDCICDRCAERGFEKVGTDYSCANGCDFDLCTSCYREQQMNVTYEEQNRLRKQPAHKSKSKASPHRQRLHAAVNAAARSGTIVRETANSTVSRHRKTSSGRARILLTPTAPGALTGVAVLPRSRQPNALAGIAAGSAVAIEHAQVCRELQAELTAEHASWLTLPPPRLDQIPLLSMLPAVQSAAREAMLRRLGGSGGMSALVLDLAPLPPASVLQPPRSTATAQDGGSGVVPFAFAHLKSYHELGWFWGGAAALGWKGCFLACVVLYTVVEYGSHATTISLGLLFGRLMLSAPSLLYSLRFGSPPPVNPDTEMARAINACPTMLELCAERAAQLIDVGAIRSAASTLKVTTDSALVNAHRHGFGIHSHRLDSLNRGPAGVRHAALFESIARSWERVLHSESPGLSPSELQLVAAWFRAWTDAEHPVMAWWQDEQNVVGTPGAASRGLHKSGRERRWAAAYGLLSAGTPGRLRCCPPSFDSAAVEAMALSRARLSPGRSWSSPRGDIDATGAQTGAQLPQDDDEAIDAATPEAITEAIAETLLDVTWDDMGSAALVQLCVEDGAFERPPSRAAFERAMEQANGVAGVFSSQRERPANFRFYDLGSVERAFGRSAAVRERHFSETDGGLRRRWIQQLQVEHRAAHGPVSTLGACFSVVLTIWPCEASWRPTSKQWVVSDPSYDLLFQSS